MSELDETIYSPSFAEVLANQGLDPSFGPTDITVEWVEFGARSAPDYKQYGEWFAIPREILAANPFTGDQEVGKLHHNGAFVSNDTVISVDQLNHYDIGARAMIFGKSIMKAFFIVGEGAILDTISVEHGVIGNNTTIGSGTTIHAGHPQRKPVIDNNVTIGKNSHISHDTYIGRGVTIGDDVWVDSSWVGDGSTLESGDTNAKPHDFDKYRGERTFVGRSRVGAGSLIETNATIENSIVGDEAIVCKRAVLENTELDRQGIIREAQRRREPASNGNGRREQEQVMVDMPDPSTYGHTKVRAKRFRRSNS